MGMKNCAYNWQRGILKKLPEVYARLLNYLLPYTKTVIAAMFFMVITAMTIVASAAAAICRTI